MKISNKICVIVNLQGYKLKRGIYNQLYLFVYEKKRGRYREKAMY